MANINIIETFFDDYKFDENVLKLNQYETITNLEEFVKTNITLLRANKGKIIYKPYYDRLLKVYQKLK